MRRLIIAVVMCMLTMGAAVLIWASALKLSDMSGLPVGVFDCIAVVFVCLSLISSCLAYPQKEKEI